MPGSGCVRQTQKSSPEVEGGAWLHFTPDMSGDMTSECWPVWERRKTSPSILPWILSRRGVEFEFCRVVSFLAVTALLVLNVAFLGSVLVLYLTRTCPVLVL
jgi:hypothetical protein